MESLARFLKTLLLRVTATLMRTDLIILDELGHLPFS